MVTDFSAGALPIGVKFCMVVRPNSDRFSSILGWIAPGMAEFWLSTGTIWWDMVLAEVFVVVAIVGRFCTCYGTVVG